MVISPAWPTVRQHQGSRSNMEHFTWNNTYSVADEELDNHHKKLFGIFNKLYDTCLKRNETAPLAAIIEELASYSTYHFHAEEQHMKELGYGGMEQHIAEHRTFAARMDKYRHAHGTNEVVVSKEIVLHLWKWLIDHVMTEDKKYALGPKRPAHRSPRDGQV
ncbi:bacteriohemerythrin [Geobacter sp. FeAm09]|uniref:bacteriohemerythrin n=1 Tax=Geobacter sp. FeAm09 TaxID=2597769 RepID=UPI0011EF28C2|nr:bacteriohemerythrin [Geobacter sp. FeAm09]QEM67497.1 bacteriohemerythrin [Geobacter sp. FeAm09]